MNENTYTAKIGDLFSMSWGYDQTNVNFFQVVKTTPKGVYVREIGKRSVPGTDGFMCCNVTADKDNFLCRSQWCGGYNCKNEPTFVKLKGNGFNFRGRYFARLTTETEKHYNSWYA